MADLRAIGVVGLAVAAPTILGAGVRAGVPIPAHITTAHRAALAKLASGDVPSADEQANSAWLAYNRRLIASRGTAPGKTHLANLHTDDLDALCEAFLNAAHAGVMVDVGTDFAEQYQLWTGQLAQQQLRQAVWEHLTESDNTELTSLGQACARVAQVREGIASGFLSSPADMLSGNLAVGALAAEMDDAGYLITGAPDAKTLRGGLSAALDASVAFVGDVSTDAALKLLTTLWGVVKAEPLFWGGAGFVAWRLLR